MIVRYRFTTGLATSALAPPQLGAMLPTSQISAGTASMGNAASFLIQYPPQPQSEVYQHQHRLQSDTDRDIQRNRTFVGTTPRHAGTNESIPSGQIGSSGSTDNVPYGAPFDTDEDDQQKKNDVEKPKRKRRKKAAEDCKTVQISEDLYPNNIMCHEGRAILKARCAANGIKLDSNRLPSVSHCAEAERMITKLVRANADGTDGQDAATIYRKARVKTFFLFFFAHTKLSLMLSVRMICKSSKSRL